MRNSRGSIQKRGNSYRVVIDCGKDLTTGKRIQKTYTVHGSKKDADKFLTEKLRELDTGVLCTGKDMLFSDYLDYWFENYCKTNLKATTCQGYIQKINHDIKPILGKIKLQELSPLQIQQFLTLKLKEGKATRTVRQFRAIIHSALEKATSWRLVALNGCSNVEAPKLDAIDYTILDKEQIIQLVQCSQESDFYIPIMIAIYTGMRRGEICGLQWDCVDLENETISITRALYNIKEKGLIFDSPKSKKSNRKISISKTLVDILKQEYEKQKELAIQLGSEYKHNNLVCCQPNGDFINPDRFNPNFKKILETNNLPNVRFHDLRHSHASLLLAQGNQLKVISDRLGHSTIGITADIYTHVYDCTNKEVADNFDALLCN